MMLLVGLVARPRRIDECGYREVYVPATEAFEGNTLAASDCTVSRSFSRVAARALDFSRSILVVDSSSCRV